MDNENKKNKLASWFARHRPSKRRLIQVYAALLYNANIKGFASGKIYTGVTKNLCVPGLNCYSCPGAVGACPLGALQNALASSKTSSLAYIFGILILFGLLLGRTVCGFLCPFGLVQELLHKIPSPKLKKNRITRILSYFKYVLLVFLVVMIPVAFATKLAVPGFCKYICPDGILFGAIGLLLNPENAELFGMLGALFTWKLCLLILFLVSAVFIYRVFCRFFCPLGAIYGFFCRLALLGVKLDRDKCINCGLCLSECKMDIAHVGDHECIHCGNCIPVCPTSAIKWSGSKYFIDDPTSALSKTANTQESEAVAQEAEAVAQKSKRKLSPTRRRTLIRIISAVLAVAVLATAIWYYNFYCVDEKTVGYSVGDICPDFTVPLIGSDESFTLSEQRGRIVVINFWATWCGPCVKELPHFETLAENYRDELTVIAISQDDETEYPRLPEFIANKDWKNALYATDSADAISGSSVFQAIGCSDALPVTLILDKDGVIIHRTTGSITYEALLAAISEAL